MIKRLFLSLIIATSAIGLSAQSFKIGTLSYNSVMKQMPEYAKAQETLSELKQKYEDEAVRSEQEFQNKFEEFLENQKNYPETILRKRQLELQNLMDINVKFRTQVQNLLAQAEADLMANVRNVLNDALSTVATSYGFVIIVNTDGDSVPYIHPQIAEDITTIVLQQLGCAQ